MAERITIIKSNPFPGLRAYRPDEGHLFFGRMESTTKVAARLKDNRFVSVIGASGSGKSSLVLSGVIPALIRENAEGKKLWSYLVFRPDINPVDNLAAELSTLSAGAGFTQLSQASIAASLHNRSEGITDVINKIRKSLRQQIVIVIDQFEEIFRYSPVSTRGTEGDEATDFIDLLVNAVQQPDQGLHLILTLRSEYVSECSRFHSLTNLMNTSSFLLPQIGRDLLSAVIEEPVKVSGATIDRSLVKIILSELSDNPGQLPVLQHLLMRMWNHWNKAGDMSRPLSIADYEAVGTLKGAISQHAGQALEELNERHRYVCSRLFRAITVRTEDGREMRRPETIATIATQTGCTVEEIINVAEVFRHPDYSFLTPASDIPLNKDSVIDLSHESIIKLWSTIRKWLDDEDASKRLYLKLAAAAEQYQEGNGKLWSAPDLFIAIKWREENNPTLAWAEKIDPAFERTMLFLKNSEEEYAALEVYNKKADYGKIKRSRLIAGILGMMVLLALIALGTLYSLRNRSEKQKSVALQLKDEAIAYTNVLGDSLNLLSYTFRTAEQEAGLEKLNAISAINRAQEAEKKASAKDNMLKEAENEKTAAVVMATVENRSKMLAVARSLAMRSINHTGEQDLQILLAWQAYLFNERHEGIEDDADIFSALYEVSKRYGNKYYSRFRPDGASVTAVAQGPDGYFFYTADTEGRVLRWQNDQPGKGYNLIWSGDKVIKAMSVSPDASWLACGTSTSEVIMIPLADDSVGYQMQNAGGSLTALIFNKTGNLLFTSTIEGAVTEWDLKSRKGNSIVGDPKGVIALEISEDNNLLAALTKDGRVMLWNPEAPGRQFTLDAGEKVITSLKFIPGREKLATGDETGIIDIWDTGTKTIGANVEGHTSAIHAIAFNKTDNQMITADKSGDIRIWALSDLTQPPIVISDSKEDIMELFFNKDGNAFLAATRTEVTQRPAHIKCMTAGLCTMVTRNLSLAEWAAYVGRDIEYEPACPDRPYKISVKEIAGAR
jgi:energy-coupling factor transporter ATP-binding protein EcfA2